MSVVRLDVLCDVVSFSSHSVDGSTFTAHSVVTATVQISGGSNCKCEAAVLEMFLIASECHQES